MPSDRQWKCQRQRSQRPLHYLSIEFVLLIQVFIELRSRRKLQRLLVTQTKDSKHTQTVVEQIVNARLQIFVEIDHHVATQDHLKLIERTVGSKVVLGKHDIAFERGTENHAVILRGVIVGKLIRAAGLMIVVGVVSHRGERKDSIARLAQDRLADVGGVDAALS